MIDRQIDIRKESGFTIVEVVVSLVLFAIVALSLVSIVEYIQYSQQQAAFVDVANSAATSKITEYRSMGYDALNVGQTDSFSNSSNLSRLPSGKTATISVTQPADSPSSKQLNVEISYIIGTQTKKVSMKAYVQKDSL